MRTGGTAPKLPLSHKTVDPRKALNIRKTFDIRKTLNLHRILLPLDGRNGTHGVSKMTRGLAQACRPVLDAEEVTVSLSTNAKGSRILFSKDLYIYLIKED